MLSRITLEQGRAASPPVASARTTTASSLSLAVPLAPYPTNHVSFHLSGRAPAGVRADTQSAKRLPRGPGRRNERRSACGRRVDPSDGPIGRQDVRVSGSSESSFTPLTHAASSAAAVFVRLVSRRCGGGHGRPAQRPWLGERCCRMRGTAGSGRDRVLPGGQRVRLELDYTLLARETKVELEPSAGRRVPRP